MQHFFLFCTMLITASEAISRGFHKNHISAGRRSKNLEFVTDSKNRVQIDLPSKFFISQNKLESVKKIVPSVNNNLLNWNDVALKKNMFRRYKKRNSRGKRSEKNERRKSASLHFENCQKNSKSFFENRCNFHHPLHHFVNPALLAEYNPIKNARKNRINFCISYPYFTNSQEQNMQLLKYLKKEFNMLTQHQVLGNKIKRSMANATAQNLPTEISLNKATNVLEKHTSKEMSDLNPLDEETMEKDRKNNYCRSSLPHACYYDPLDSFSNDLPSPVMIPKVNFKYPYDLKLYERSSYRDRNLDSGEGAVSGNHNNEIEKSEGGNTRHNVQKLKNVLEDVENMLKAEVAITSESKENNIPDSNEPRENPSSNSIKDKIDKVAIPILKEISEQLSQESGEISSKNLSKPQKLSKTHHGIKIHNPSKTQGTSKTHNADKTQDTSKMSKNHESGKKTNVLASSEKKNQSAKYDRDCSPSGIWSSDILGADINVTVLPNLMLKVTINSIKRNGFINRNWHVQGLTLSERGGPLILAALYPPKKRLASFIGQCKVYENKDLIFGIWTVSNCLPTCNDVWTAVETKMDIFRRKKKKS